MIKALAVLIGAAVALALPNAAAPAAAAPTAGTFTVVLTGSAVTSAALDTIRDAGGTVTGRTDEIGVVQVRAADSSRFLSSTLGRPGIASVGPSLRWELPTHGAPADVTHPDGGASSNPADYSWNIDRVTGNGAAWRHETGSRNVVVGVIDSGFDFDHPDLKANIVPGSKTFVPGTTDARDALYHGTHVAGTIAANGTIKGVAPNVGIRAYRVFDAGSAQTTWITAAIVAAAKDGVDVINMSLGGLWVNGQVFYTDPTTGRRIALGNDVADRLAFERAIRFAVGRNVTVVASAGNDALNITDRTSATRALNQLLVDSGLPEYSAVGATVAAPALLPGVVTVSATGGGFGTQDRLAFYSNYGAGAIDVSAPGGDLGPSFPAALVPDAYKYLVLSTTPSYLPCHTLEQALFDCRYGWAAGTSMASPHVAGVAALFISSEFRRTGVKPSAATVVRRLTQGAEDIGKTGYDGLFGHGLANALSAVTAH